MSKWRRAAKVDSNQAEIVKALRKIPWVTVEVGHDDLLIGYRSNTFWIELKQPDAVSKKTGEIKESALKPKQKDLRENWCGHYAICWNLEQILEEIGIAP